jgi:hypothetical protein
MKDMRRTSLLALPKNPRRNHLRFYCIVTVWLWLPLFGSGCHPCFAPLELPEGSGHQSKGATGPDRWGDASVARRSGGGPQAKANSLPEPARTPNIAA